MRTSSQGPSMEPLHSEVENELDASEKNIEKNSKSEKKNEKNSKSENKKDESSNTKCSTDVHTKFGMRVMYTNADNLLNKASERPALPPVAQS